MRLIARGGMGSVYEARQVQLDRPVAIKFLHPPLGHLESERESFEKRFNLEAAALARLSDTHIVSVFDYGQTDDGRSFLVMEYVDGPPLSTVLKEEAPLAPERALRLMLQVCAALHSAHSQGVVHRDLKPSNLLLKRGADGREQVKVVDFGLVKLTRDDQTITLDGLVMGSPHYMSPEQVRGIETDARSDVYAMGALLFRCVTARPPFHGPTSTATMLAHLQEPVPSLAEALPGATFPAGLERIIHRCMDKDPDHRYQDVLALKADLESLIEPGAATFPSASSLSPAPTAPAPAPASARSPLLPWLLAGVAGLLLMVFLALRFLPGPTPAPTQETQREPVPVVQEQPTPAPPPAVPEPVTVRVSIVSEPSGAEVLLGGELLGTTPLLYESTTLGTPDLRRFAFRLAGHQGRTIEQDLSAGGAQQISARLDPLPTPTSAPAPVQNAVKAEPTPAAPSHTPDGYKKSPYD